MSKVSESSAVDAPKITPIHCALCGAPELLMKTHFMPKPEDGSLKCLEHPKYKNGEPMNPDDALAEYKRLYPYKETVSTSALRAAESKMKAKESTAHSKVGMATTATETSGTGSLDATVTHTHGHAGITEYTTEKAALHEVLGLPAGHLMNALGKPIITDIFINRPFPEFVPEVNKAYVFNDVELIKDILMMFTTGMPGYLWGHAGTGKSSLPTQIAARLGRPVIRSQHTASTEESHITGQILAKDGRTYFEPGLLTLAMKHGFIYLADEYDFAYPQILSLYQPVLEGEPLILKEATPEWRRTVRHKHFAFLATGNTNGSGDETGLYQGTNQQNAANYSRFALVSKVEYMPEAQEIAILVANGIPEQLAKKLVNFAKRCREAYEAHEIAQPIGPRELLNAGTIGVMRNDPILGLKKAYVNKLPSASAVAALEFAQRLFGKAA
ncbi:AAA family ATPase [Xenorhabdus szentirmaii]|uniref:Porphyrin biosynthetic protein n=1 Tax=Xenorhabdus szentirmaii DSM 16338 TaxID=1427518 RepID=W1IRG1_9GAMM|nr:AAA family ATPase [Xenorhabdus szentirmaii]PHM30592.1 porphyrin biosynthesis protein [Xenorhabdus szentirmaii DSM 16338]CDL81067.1 putative porphyrin biosynthetic protein [Xenorhabdus szentirmaii DSM 16338]